MHCATYTTKEGGAKLKSVNNVPSPKGSEGKIKDLEKRLIILEQSLPDLLVVAKKILADQNITLGDIKKLKSLILKLVIGKDTNRN